MQKRAKRVTVLTGVAGAAVAGTAALFLAGGPAFAEDPTPSPSASSSASAQPDREAMREQRQAQREQRQDEFAEALAAELGIDKEKVAAAVDKVREAQRTEARADRLEAMKTRLDEAVKAGKLTQEQADAILKAAESGVFQGGFGGGHGRGGFPGR